MRIVRLTPIDGELPNIALMKLAHYHRAQGDDVYLERSLEPTLFEPQPDIVYGSSIFNFSADRTARFRKAFPTAFVSGTGTERNGGITVEAIIGEESYENYDYSIYPDETASIGFTQRGCRLKCGFCVVPVKEGKPRGLNTIERLWRGDPYPRHLHILDNDFFGQPEWKERIAEIRDGAFKICLSQGINVRLIHPEGAAALATIDYRNKDFTAKRLYTAWDNVKDEKVFFRGMDMLEAAGIPGKHVMAYMLIGYDPAETWDRIWHRFTRMVERKISPYPMVFNRSRSDLLCFQRWVIAGGGQYRFIPWGEYQRETKTQESVEAWKPYAERLAIATAKPMKVAA